jgi:hypothetical protein
MLHKNLSRILGIPTTMLHTNPLVEKKKHIVDFLE